jgi:putative glutamine amidotransferase
MALIAITACSKLHDYEESIRRAGGEPRVVGAGSVSPADVIRDARGLLLTGGGDVDPGLYGEAPHQTFNAAEPGRDAFEIDLVRRALESDLPILAICRGIQLLNVACGGTLVQDIFDQLPDAGTHRVLEPSFAIAHDVWITEGTLLNRLMRERLESDECQVNSRHHQAVKAVGEGLVVTATAPDGVVEALEDPSRRFCLAVQWHPENFYRTGEFRALFEGFLEAADAPSGRVG